MAQVPDSKHGAFRSVVTGHVRENTAVLYQLRMRFQTTNSALEIHQSVENITITSVNISNLDIFVTYFPVLVKYW